MYMLCELIEQQKSSTNTRTRLANDAFLLKLPPPSRNCSDTFFDRSFTYGAPCEWNKLDERVRWLQTTQPTSGGAVTVVSSCCANCVEPPRPHQWGPDLPFFCHAGHADPLDGWRCCSQKRVMSRPIQVRQL